MVENCGLLSFLKQANKRILGKSSLNQAMGNSGEVYCGVKLIRPWLIFELGQSGMGMIGQRVSYSQIPFPSIQSFHCYPYLHMDCR